MILRCASKIHRRFIQRPGVSFTPVVLCVGETGASCCNVQLKLLLVKSMLDALFRATYTLNVLLVLIKCTMPLILHIVVR